MSGVPGEGPLWLASRSPRRRSLLAEAGFAVQVRPAEIDDGTLVRGAVTPPEWVMALAYLKARWVADALAGDGAEGIVLGADTMCVHGDRMLGQPADAAAARTMLCAFRDTVHETMTGVCLLRLDDRRRWLLVDRARVSVGHVGDEAIDAYVESGQWRGKAGGYNLAERQAAGWPIECAGDPATVMGLPIRRLAPWLQRARAGAGGR
jgi:septum formation protein